MPFKDNFYLLNSGEQTLYRMLCAVAPKMIVFSQVSMSQIFYIGDRQKNKRDQLKKIGLLSVDFLICREDTSIILAIELNGPDHDLPDCIERDKRKLTALKEAGIPLLTLLYKDLDDEKALKNRVANCVSERLKIEDARKLDEANRHYYCSACKIIVSDEVANYCWQKNNKLRFGNKVFCRSCQDSVL